MTGDVVVRELTPDESSEAFDLGAVTFGLERTSPTAQARGPRPGVTRYGAFDRNGRLLGKVNELHHEQWWSGRRIPAADIGGVAVLPEARGRGIAHTLLRHLLEQARERGAALSTLFPTVAAAYRSAGWTMAGAMRSYDVPTALLPRRNDPPHRNDLLSRKDDFSRQDDGHGLTARPGDPVDLLVIDSLYEEIARSRNGLLSRTGPLFTRDPYTFPDGVDGVTVVEGDSGPVAGAIWGRAGGFRAGGILRVDALLGTDPEAMRVLLGILASWRPVAPTTRILGVPSGIASRELPLEAAHPYRCDWWMLRPVDVVRLIAARRWPDEVKVGTTFTLVDDLAPWNAGTWQLEMADGRAQLEPARSTGATRLSIEGLGALICGKASTALLVENRLAEAGLSGALDALGAVPHPELLDHF